MANRSHERHPDNRQHAVPPTDRSLTPERDTARTSRPLSDIREITEPSILDAMAYRTKQDTSQKGPGRQSSFRKKNASKRTNTVKIVEPSTIAGRSSETRARQRLSTTSSDGANEGSRSSVYSIPPSSVPPRASSRARSPLKLPSHRTNIESIETPPRGLDQSPMRSITSQPITDSSDSPPQRALETYARNPAPVEILERPICRHARVGADLHITAPLFAGGGSVEGYVRVVVDDTVRARHRNDLYIARLTVDLLGVEELVGQHRKAAFISLASDLFDNEHPPPRNMITTTISQSETEAVWALRPSATMIPFRIDLPLDVGPAPFYSRWACIKYTLFATLIILDSGTPYTVRCSQGVNILSTYDPERALRSLPSPLTAFDEIAIPRAHELERIRLTAGLHRQVWLSGTSIFVDVHIANRSRRVLKRLQLNVERDILCYKHGPASTLEKSAGQARIFEDKQQTILGKTNLKTGQNGWNGVQPYSSMVRTCDIDIPRGHATIKCGKFFEVRFFLNISVGTSRSNLVTVQLPIILIHMNSLDVLPNAMTQVARAIEEKRQQQSEHDDRHHHSKSMKRDRGRKSGHHKTKSNASSVNKQLPTTTDPRHLQGRAFAAPRQQSLKRIKAQAAELEDLGDILDRSPRKYASSPHNPRSKSPSIRKPHRQYERQMHNAPYNASLAALSVAHYGTFNPSTPDINRFPSPKPTHRRPHFFSSSAESVKDRIRKIRSRDSLNSRRRDASRASHRSKGRSRSRNPRRDPHWRRGSSEGAASEIVEHYFDGTSDRLRDRDRRGGSSPKRSRSKSSTRLGLAAQAIGPGMLGLLPYSVQGRGAGGISPRDRAGNGRVTDITVASSATEIRGRGRRRGDEFTTSSGNGAPSGRAQISNQSVVRRASLRLKESLDRMEGSRFEFRAVAGKGRSLSRSRGEEGVVQRGLGWFRREKSRGRGQERDWGGDQQGRSGWI